MVLFGSSLFLIYAMPPEAAGSGAQLGWTRRALATSAGAVLVGSLAGLLTQTSILAGSISEGLRLSSLSAVITTMALGPATLARCAAAAVALSLVLALPLRRTLCIVCVALGLVVNASFAWTGHGAATEGPLGLVHTTADVVHTLAAGVWIGALVMFAGLLHGAGRHRATDQALHRALQGFAGVGTALVAVLIATGLVNSWFLIGPTHLSGLWTTVYGRLLSLKLVLFVGMLGLAAANRYRLTPALGASLRGDGTAASPVTALRRSLLIETGAGFGVLFLVAWLGTQDPVSAISRPGQ